MRRTRVASGSADRAAARVACRSVATETARDSRRRSTAAGSSPSGSRRPGVTKLFTLSGGHLFSIYDGCREEGIDIVDVRHEQTAAFAAEGWAKATRSPAWRALTAGPGVTNGMSALASAQANGSPVVVLGGRAPAMRWGMGSLQEIDHVPFVAPLVKSARTADVAGRDPGARRRGAAGRAWSRRPAPRSSTSRSTTSSRRGRVEAGARRAARPARRCRRPTAADRARRRALRVRGAAGGDGGDRALLGARRGRAARAVRGAAACRCS